MESNAGDAKTGEGSLNMTKTILASIGIGYLASWLVHGGLVKRIKNTRYYMGKGHSLRRAWYYSGITL